MVRGVLPMPMAFPSSLELTPVSRRPLELPQQTLATIAAQPLPPPSRSQGNADLSIAVVTFDNLACTRLCLESFLTDPDATQFEIIVVDNGSTDGTRDYLTQLAGRFANVRLILNERNRGFAAANNQALAIARGSRLVLLNNDAIVLPPMLRKLVNYLEDPSIGLIGPVTNRIGNEAEIETNYRTYGELLQFAQERAEQKSRSIFDIPTLCMFCLAMRRDVYLQLGPLDERYEIGLLEDDDYSMRAHRAHLRVICAEDVFVHHFGQASFGGLYASGEYQRILEANRKRFEDKWGVPWQPYGRRVGQQYGRQRERISAIVSQAVPAGSVVLIVSKGDEELLRLRDRVGCHFPQDERGSYAGYHPRDSSEAIAGVETAISKGAQYLLIPAASAWWLDHYNELAKWLTDRHERVWSDDACVIYRLAGTSPATSERARMAFATEPAQHLRFALDYPQTLPLTPPQGTADPKRLQLHWVIPDFTSASGGAGAVFRMIHLLEQFGHHSTLWIHGGTHFGSAEAARSAICERFPALQAAVNILHRNTDDLHGDAVVATHCWTAYPVRAVTRVRARFYFVQDFEPMFFPMGSEYLLAEETYRFGFHCICSSRWLQTLLKTRYGAKAERFIYGYDRGIYHPAPAISRAENRIAFYARAGTARRAVELGLLALELLARRRQFVVDFFGADMGCLKVPYEYHDHGVLCDQDLSRLYAQATVGLAFSATNPSIVPHEMMACGLPVLDLETEATVADFPREAITLAQPIPQQIADSLDRLLSDRTARETQARYAQQHVAPLSWEASARAIERALLRAVQPTQDQRAQGASP